MKKLIKGIVDFRRKSITDYRRKFSKLALRQSPDALLVACCDSRVVPNIFASSDPGAVFVLRNIGNLIPPYQKNNPSDSSVAATIEFSLASLNVSDIVICGHSECGAMLSLIENNDAPTTQNSCLSRWLENAASSYQRFKDGSFISATKTIACNHLSKINVLQQLDNLKTYPLVTERLERNNLRIHGWWFDLATANVYYYNQVYRDFILINDKEAQNILASLESPIIPKN